MASVFHCHANVLLMINEFENLEEKQWINEYKDKIRFDKNSDFLKVQNIIPKSLRNLPPIIYSFVTRTIKSQAFYKRVILLYFDYDWHIRVWNINFVCLFVKRLAATSCAALSVAALRMRPTASHKSRRGTSASPRSPSPSSASSSPATCPGSCPTSSRSSRKKKKIFRR